jgi:hypothetical protein
MDSDRRVRSRRRVPVPFWQRRGCDGKYAYPSKRNAAAVARADMRLYGGDIHAYRCPLCRAWPSAEAGMTVQQFSTFLIWTQSVFRWARAFCFRDQEAKNSTPVGITRP